MTNIVTLYEHFINHPRICIDSRNIISDSLFFAFRGTNFNGNEFASQAIKSGAAFAIVDDPKFVSGPQCLLVDDALSALQSLANYHRQKLNIPVLAITGSNGKTTTKELIRNILSKKYKTLATKGNLNNHIGVPLTILSISKEIEFAVIEMGANHLHEINSYCKIAEPDYGLITNVGKAHLEGFGGFEGVKKGKSELYFWIAEKGNAIFINSDNDHLNKMAEDAGIKTSITYGKKNNLFCSGDLISEVPKLIVKWNCKDAKGNAESPMTGAYNFENILSAICVGNYFGVSAEQIDKAISEYNPDNSRSQVVHKGSNTIILDAYNANPTSMEAALANFLKISATQKILFIGDMAELGDESSEEHKRIAGIIGNGKFNKVFFVGNNFGELNTLPGMHFSNSDQAADWVKNNPVSDSYILIKGSRSTKMEKIFEAI